MTDPSPVGLTGLVVVTLTDAEGRVKDVQEATNLVTTAGDQYYARKAVAAVAPAAPVAPSAATGMKLGTSSATAAAKSGAGAALVTYLTASNATFASGYPSATAYTGTDTGWTANYQCVWAAGVATSSVIKECVIVTDAASNATSTAANTIARVVFGSTVNKTSTDTLTVTWSHRLLGA